MGTLIEPKNLRVVMSTPQGRAFIFSLLDVVGAERNGYSQDPVENKILAGQRSIGQMILNVLREMPPGGPEMEDGLTLELKMRREHQATENERRKQEAKLQGDHRPFGN